MAINLKSDKYIIFLHALLTLFEDRDTTKEEMLNLVKDILDEHFT